MESRSVQTCQALYNFTFGAAVKVTRISDFFNKKGPSTQELMPLNFEEKVRFFSVASTKQSLIALTGGCDDSSKPSVKCFAFNTVSGQWSNTSLPDLEEGRFCHSSCSVDNTVYVFGGRFS